MSPAARWLVVATFGSAMGYLEAAVVFYLRTLVDRIEPYQARPLPDIPALGNAELVRELATLIMLATVGWLAGRTWRGRIGFGLIAFGVWDVTYYLFLIPLTGWPHTVFDWDILFLLPLPWWGPVWSPVSVALLMILFGILATALERAEPPIWPRRAALMVTGLGILVALYAFMADAIAAAPRGEESVRAVLPEHFPVWIFATGWLMMAVAPVNMAWQLARRYR